MRLDRLLLRLFEEEADLPIYIFVDTSKSMGIGEPGKLDFARRFAAALAYVGLINHDRVSMVAFSDGVISEMPARRGKNQMWRTLHFLERLSSDGNTSLHNAFRSFFGARRTRGLVIIASDFLDRAGFEPAFQVIRQFGHQVFAAHVVSPEDREPTFGDDVVLVDAEDATSVKAHLTPELLGAYRKGFASYCAEIESFCRSHGWGYLRADTDAPFERLMLRALRHEGLLR